MQTLTESVYIPEELFSQQGSTAEDAKFDKTLMADLSCQARHPMIVTSADAAYCYDQVNHVIMSLVWLVLTNGNFPAIVAALICLQTMKIFQRMGFGKLKTFFGGPFYFPCMMGLGQGNRASPSVPDSAQCGLSQRFQAVKSWRRDTRPHHRGDHPFHGCPLCRRHRSLHLAREHS